MSIHFFMLRVFNSHTRRTSRTAAVLAWLTTLLTAACSPLQPPATPASVAVPMAFKTPAPPPTNTDTTPGATPATPPSPSAWWTVYRDPALDPLIEQASRDNANLQTAAARVAHAQAIARHSAASTSPAVGLGAGLTRQQGPLVNAAGTQGNLATAGVTASYELDVWGRVAKGTAAATSDLRAQESLRQNVLLLVQTQVAQTYLSLRALDEEAALQAQLLQTRLAQLRIHEQRHTLGSVSAAQLTTYRQDIDALRMDSAMTEQARNSLENALAVLLGQTSSTFHLPKARWHAELPSVRPGLPAAVLARRPDIAAAQQTVLGTQQRLAAAQTVWLPNLTLTGSGGFASPDLKDLFSASMQSLMLGMLANLPLFDGGRREAQTAMVDAERLAALAQYREQVLHALREVDDQLNAAQSLNDQAVMATASLEQAVQRAEMADSLYRSGLSSKLDNLDAHTQAWQARRLHLKVKSAQFQTTVSLIRALGGGWD